MGKIIRAEIYICNMTKVTISHIKADIGSLPGHTTVYEPVVDTVRRYVKEHSSSILSDFYISHIGDDIQITMIHDRGIDNEEVHRIAWVQIDSSPGLGLFLRYMQASQG